VLDGAAPWTAQTGRSDLGAEVADGGCQLRTSGDKQLPGRAWQGLVVSFDVFFQGFADGDARPGGGAHMREVLGPFITREDLAHSCRQIVYGDGEADVYLSDDNMMANHISGTDPWELLVQGARSPGWVILPAGCPTCLTDDDQRHHLPEGLDDQAVVVTTGADLLQTITSN